MALDSEGEEGPQMVLVFNGGKVVRETTESLSSPCFAARKFDSELWKTRLCLRPEQATREIGNTQQRTWHLIIGISRK